MFKSSILVTCLSLALSVVGFFSQVLIAKFFGAGYSLDIYLTVSSFPLLFSAVISSALSYSLTPKLIDVRLKYQCSFGKFQGFFLKQLISIILVFILIFGLISYFFLPFIYSTIKVEYLSLAHKILFFSWLNALSTILLGVFSSQYNSKQKFLHPLLFSFSPYLFSIIFIILFNQKFGVLSIAAGLFLGSWISVIWAFFNLRREISFYGISNDLRAIVWSYIKKLPISAIAMLCFTIYQSIDAFWAPKLGPSNLSYLGYCQRLLIAVGALVVTGPSTVLVPRLTQSITERRFDDFLQDVGLIVKVIFSLASLIAVTGSALSLEIIQIMFMRGAFRELDAIGVSKLLPWMLTGMVFMLCVVIMFRMLFVQKAAVFVAFIGISSAFLYFVFSGIAVSKGHVIGIAFAYIITWLFLFVFCICKIFSGNLTRILNKDSLLFLTRLGVTITIIWSITYLFRGYILRIIHFSTIVNAITAVVICSILSGIIFFLMLIKIFKQRELIFLVDGIYNLFFQKKNRS